LAKTLALKTLASAVAVRFKRLQFTPDMLPADIVGTMIYNPQDGAFRTKQGPIFSNLILADEINRAPAKVQSALLEAMQERQVTIGDETYPLPNPFLVLATQNPLEQEGTYPLPEAQIDRFMMKVLVSYPSRAEERAILDAMATSEALAERSSGGVCPADPERPPCREQSVRGRQDQELHRGSRARDAAAYCEILEPRWIYQTGASPRATINLTLAARAIAFLNGRHYVTPQDVKTIALDVLRHRVSVTYEAEAENVTSERRDPQNSRRPPGALIAHAGRHHQIDEDHHERHAATGDPHPPHGQRQPGRGIPFGVQGPRHGLRRSARIQPGRRSAHHRLNVTARAGRPFVKKFTEERELTILLLVDISASGNFGSAD